MMQKRKLYGDRNENRNIEKYSVKAEHFCMFVNYNERGGSMRISGSISAVHGDYMEYARQLKYVNVDCIHIDIFENSGGLTINSLLDFDDTYLPLDVHLIYENVSDDTVRIVNEAGVSYLNVQFEKLADKGSIPHLAASVHANFGLAYTADTPMEVIENNLQYCSQVLFMCTEPGVSGAEFNDANYERIGKFHKEHPQFVIFADGGIDGSRAKKMAGLGVAVAVSGSFLCQDQSRMDMSAFALKYFDEQDVLADYKMVPAASLPVVSEDDAFSTLINIMNRYRYGVVFVVTDGKLKGMIADGDVRRGFIKYGKEIFDKNASDLMNPKPYSVPSKTAVRDIYHDISVMHKGIEVIPVMEDGRMIGALDLKLGK